MRVLLPALVLAAVALVAAAPSHPLVDQMRARVAEAAELEKEFGGGLGALAGDSLTDLARVDFVLGAARSISHKFLNEDDERFVYTAMKGQRPEEFEANLPAMVNYVRLATAARFYHARARTRRPLYGERAGFEQLESIARRVYDFRNAALVEVRARRLSPAKVLTPDKLGELADPRLFEQLHAAHLAGRSQFTNQRNSVVFVVLAFELLLSYGIATVILRRRRPAVVVRV